MDCHLPVHKVIAKQACNPHLQSQSITKIQTEGSEVKKVTHLLILFIQSWSFFHKLIHASCICPALKNKTCTGFSDAPNKCLPIH